MTNHPGPIITMYSIALIPIMYLMFLILTNSYRFGWK
jgi:hypothetical protein